MQNATLISKATIAIEIRTRKFNAQYGSKRAYNSMELAHLFSNLIIFAERCSYKSNENRICMRACRLEIVEHKFRGSMQTNKLHLSAPRQSMMQPIQYIMAKWFNAHAHSHIYSLNYHVLVFPTFHMRTFCNIISFPWRIEHFGWFLLRPIEIAFANDDANFFPIHSSDGNHTNNPNNFHATQNLMTMFLRSPNLMYHST